MGLVQSTQITFQHSNTVRFQSTQFDHSHSISNFHEVKLYFYYRINTETIFALFIVFSFNWQCVQHVLLHCTQNYTCILVEKFVIYRLQSKTLCESKETWWIFLDFCFVLFRTFVRYLILLHFKNKAKKQCL